jgi:hypothetical protein
VKKFGSTRKRGCNHLIDIIDDKDGSSTEADSSLTYICYDTKNFIDYP